MESCGKTNKAKEENNEKTATEIMNLKITNAQMQSYQEEQKMPDLQYLANRLCEDGDMAYVEIKNKETASFLLPPVEIKSEEDSILTKLKDYPYEFEIDGKLRLASIDGVKVADSTTKEEIEQLNKMIQDLQNDVKEQQTTIISFQKELEKIQTNHTNDNYSLNEEREVGTWYDGTPMWELSLAITIPTTSKDGTDASERINLQNYNIKECMVYNGFIYTAAGNFVTLPIWTGNAVGQDTGVMTLYSFTDKQLIISNTRASYSGRKGCVTIRYSKNN